MPESPEALVLVENRTTASGHEYADRTGVSYEFPTQYRRLMQPGTEFVYYRSREGHTEPHYFGAGVVGPVRISRVDPTRLECDVLDFRPFENAVAFKDSTGNHLEMGGATRGHYQSGVRRITEDELASILSLADLAPAEAHVVAGDVPAVGAKYGTSETSKLVDEFAVARIMELLPGRYPGAKIKEMPHNNPGYDIRVSQGDAVLRFVEVKGTQQSAPTFFLSEGERKFSAQEAHRYSLYVVFGVRLDAGTHDIAEWTGEVSVAECGLEVSQWRGRLPG